MFSIIELEYRAIYVNESHFLFLRILGVQMFSTIPFQFLKLEFLAFFKIINWLFFQFLRKLTPFHPPSLNRWHIFGSNSFQFDLSFVFLSVVLDDDKGRVLHFINFQNTIKYPEFIFNYSGACASRLPSQHFMKKLSFYLCS